MAGGARLAHRIWLRLSGYPAAHPWTAALALGLPCLAAGVWGYFAQDSAYQKVGEAIAYFWLPLLILSATVASLVWRPNVILVAVALLDAEAALLGASQPIALPFVVAVPMIGVGVAVRCVPASMEKIPYLAAFVASVVGVSIAALRSLDLSAPSGLVIIPAFSLVEAIALAMLWRLDAGRLNALEGVVAAEARVRDLLDGVELIGVHVNRESRIDFINEFALRLTGWRREEVIGADWWDTFATPDRREAARDNYDYIISGRRSMAQHRESRILTKSGDVRLIRWSHVTRRDPNGRMTGLASLGEDITAIRAAEDELKRGAELVSKVVMASPLPTVVLGLDRTVQLWNPAAADLLGWSQAEVIGRPMPAVFVGRDRWGIARRFVRAVHGHPLDPELIDLTRRDGQVVRVRLYGGALRDREDKPMSVALQAIDVTASLAMEEQLREAQKMEAIGRLAGGVAHDFNNSLTAIGGFASLIATDSQEPETRESARTILGAAQHAATLTRELLAYSRKSFLQPQVVDLNDLVTAVRPMLQPLVGENVSVVLESRGSTAMVRVDPGGFERVILNLAANARDAMPGGGTLTLAIDRRSTDETVDAPARRWVALCVSDTGVGIPAELHSQVFDPFFTTKPVGSGTGLGLAMVKGFVVQSGGTVTLQSEPGSGTAIEILLPEVQASTIQGALPSAVPAAVGGEETILVVEDEPAVAAVSFQVLSRSGYHILLADSGDSAIALLRAYSGPIALLLLDVILPDVRGPVLAEVAKTIHPESAALFASGYSTEAMGRRGDLAGEVDLIQKPFAPEELLARVRRAIDRTARPTA